MSTMAQQFTAIYKKQGKLFSAWVEEIHGVNTQGKTLREAKENLKEALALVLSVNKALSQQDATGRVIRESVRVSV